MAHDSSPGEENDAVALVRVYCGLASADEAVQPASAGSPLTIAVVDDAGRLLGVHEISDDPAGYAEFGALLVERTSGFTGAAVAADSDDHMVTSLLTAAGRPLVVADDDSVDDFAERFADDGSIEEMQAPPAARRAVGLARALQAGALSAVTNPTPRELVTYKPVLAAHVAMLNGRQAAAMALREVLRELYPAALRAYPDPARQLPMAVLELLPEPGRLTGGASRSRDPEEVAQAVAAELSRTGAGEAAAIAEAVTALQVAISESPRRGGVNKSLAPAVADTVRHAVAAVRSCDAACEALVGTLTARVSPQAATQPGRRSARRVTAPEPASTAGLQAVPSTDSGGPTRVSRRNRQEPAAGNSPAAPRPMASPPVAPQPMMPPPSAPRPVTRPPMAPAAAAGQPGRTPNPPGNRPVSVPPPPPGMTPIVPGSRSPVPPADAGQPFRPTLTNAAISNARAERQRTVIPPRPNTRSPGAPSTFGAADYSSLPMPPQRPAPEAAEPGSRANWPLAGPAQERSAPPAAGAAPPAVTPPSTGAASATGRVRPPWQADDLPPEPPSLRLVEPQLSDRASNGIGDLTEPPPLRLVDRDLADRAGRARPQRRSGLTALDRSSTPPVSDEGDGDLLIFAAARSAWFTGQDSEAEREWATQADTGWRAAEKAARPEVAAETPAGLPKRVPQANLVPGSPLREERPLRIVRDAASIAAHTTGYFRGWRRGQEIGGYAVGGRPGRESAGGWDFTRDGGGQNEDYRNNAGYRSS